MKTINLNDYNLFRVASSSPDIIIGDIDFNINNILEDIKYAHSRKTDLILFPELSITGYTMGDLFFQNIIIQKTYDGINKLLVESEKNYRDIIIVVGGPLATEGRLFNCAFLLLNGKILGIIPKTHIPNYNEFYEKRWFSSSRDKKSKVINFLGQKSVPFDKNIIFQNKNNVSLAIEICEDLWAPIPPSSYHSINGANIILNLSASNELVEKSDIRREVVKQQSKKCNVAYIYSSSNHSESTTDIVFSGHLLIVENSSVLAEMEFGLNNKVKKIIIQDIDLEKIQNVKIKKNNFIESFQKFEYKIIDFYIEDKIANKLLRNNIKKYAFKRNSYNVKKIIDIQTAGLIKRIEYIKVKNIIIGVSGGLDSALALLICVNAFNILNISLKNIIAVTMPGFGTSNYTYNNAVTLIKELGVTFKEISIEKSCIQHFKDINHPEDSYDITYENAQARERTQILMDLSNKYNGFVVGTGSLSEIALGWCTYNADHMSMYAVNSGVPKTLVKSIICWIKNNTDSFSNEIKKILENIITTEISPELLPPSKHGEIKQKTEEIIGDYMLHDFFLYHVVKYGLTPKKIILYGESAFKGVYSKEEIKKWLKIFYKRFFNSQFKRNCMPDGPKVESISLSPRGDWRMPSDASAKIWIDEIESL